MCVQRNLCKGPVERAFIATLDHSYCLGLLQCQSKCQYEVDDTPGHAFPEDAEITRRTMSSLMPVSSCVHHISSAKKGSLSRKWSRAEAMSLNYDGITT